MTSLNVIQGSETLSLMALAAVLVFCFILVSCSRLPILTKQLLLAALGLRLLGAGARYLILVDVYDRSGDAIGYYKSGLQHAASFRDLDFSALTEPPIEALQGTQFLRLFSGGVLSFLGPSMYGEFVVFALLGFLGLVAFGIAFSRSFPNVSHTRYLCGIWLFPSLWFWPSSVGKEAVILLGLGLAVAGFIGRKGRINWYLLAGGLFLILAVRQQLLGILLVAMLIAQWLSFEGKWTLGKMVQAVLIAAVALLGIGYAGRNIGIEQFDAEGITSFIESNQSRETLGNTYVESSKPSLSGAPKALFNVVARPLPWEASNPMVLISSIEIVGVWFLIFIRRRELMMSFRTWRSHRITRLAVAFIILYSIGLGLMVVNIGIIARQRIFLFPFLFILLEAVPAYTNKIPPARMKPKGRRVTRKALVSQQSGALELS